MKLLELFKTKTSDQLVQEIHDEFDSAQDRLLCQAKAFLSQERSDIGERAKKIGFSNIPSAKKHDELVSTKAEAELIEYYKMAYPFLKFLTVKEMERICNKYGLIYAESHRYIKDIPEKNIRDIENAQPLKRKDSQYTGGTPSMGTIGYTGPAYQHMMMYGSGGGGGFYSHLTENYLASIMDVEINAKQVPTVPQKSQEEIDNEPVSASLNIWVTIYLLDQNLAERRGFYE